MNKDNNISYKGVTNNLLHRKELIYDYLDESEIKALKNLLNSKVVETPAGSRLKT